MTDEEGQSMTDEDRISHPRLRPALETAIKQASERYGVEISTLRAFARIESGGNPRARAGSYYGVYQLSHAVFRQYGGRGNIYDLSANTSVAARKHREESDAFALRHGRAPAAVDLYMMHQQGVAGAAMHMENPDDPAWLNMHRTTEGQLKGSKWARLAIWGNVPCRSFSKALSYAQGLALRQSLGDGRHGSFLMRDGSQLQSDGTAANRPFRNGPVG